MACLQHVGWSETGVWWHSLRVFRAPAATAGVIVSARRSGLFRGRRQDTDMASVIELIWSSRRDIWETDGGHPRDLT